MTLMCWILLILLVLARCPSVTCSLLIADFIQQLVVQYGTVFLLSYTGAVGAAVLKRIIGLPGLLNIGTAGAAAQLWV